MIAKRIGNRAGIANPSAKESWGDDAVRDIISSEGDVVGIDFSCFKADSVDCFLAAWQVFGDVVIES